MSNLFRSAFATPTDEQAALVGHLVMDWALIEKFFSMVIARLAGGPDYTTRTLTDRVDVKSQMRAVQFLCKMHRQRYNLEVVSDAVIAQIENVIKPARDLYDSRNAVAHWAVWRINDDELASDKLSGNYPTPHEHFVIYTLDQLKALIAEARRIQGVLEAAADAFPRVPEPVEQR